MPLIFSLPYNSHKRRSTGKSFQTNEYEKWEWTNIGFHDEFQGNNIKEIYKLSRELKSLYNKLLKGEYEGE